MSNCKKLKRTVLNTETVKDLFAFPICLLKVTSFLERTNYQTLPTQLCVIQLTLYNYNITLVAEILDVCA